MTLVDQHGQAIASTPTPSTRQRRDVWSEDELTQIWDRYGPYIQAAIDEGEYHSLEYIQGRVAEGTAQLWPGQACAIVTEVHQYDEHVVLYFWLAGGNLKEICHMVPLIEKLCRHKWGCDRAVIKGRSGWGRVLEGYKPTQTIFTKELQS